MKVGASRVTVANPGGERADTEGLPSGIRGLLHAVLGNALRSLSSPITIYVYSDGKREVVSGSEFGAAAYWLKSDSRDSPFDFLTLCEFLGLRPDRGRELANRAVEKRRREINAAKRKLRDGVVRWKCYRASYGGPAIIGRLDFDADIRLD